MVEWITLYDEGKDKCESSWVRSVGWRNDTLILKRYENEPQNFETYKYDEVPRKIFDRINQEYQNGNSVGSAINKYIIRNKEIPSGDRLD